MGRNSTGPPPGEYANPVLQTTTDDKEQNNTGSSTLFVGGPVIN